MDYLVHLVIELVAYMIFFDTLLYGLLLVVGAPSGDNPKLANRYFGCVTRNGVYWLGFLLLLPLRILGKAIKNGLEKKFGKPKKGKKKKKKKP